MSHYPRYVPEDDTPDDDDGGERMGPQVPDDGPDEVMFTDIDLRHVLRTNGTSVERLPAEAWDKLVAGGYSRGFIVIGLGDTVAMCGQQMVGGFIVGLAGLARLTAQMHHAAAQLDGDERTRYLAMVDQYAAQARDSGPSGRYVPPDGAGS